MKYFKTLIFAVLIFGTSVLSRADEGMWLIQNLTRDIVSKMEVKGLLIDGKAIYDEDNLSLSDAVVSLDFGCTGSIISNEGLVITNHHCAYGYVHDLSTSDKNYLEDGFWAMERSQEAPLKGAGIYFLKKILDVTDEVNQVISDLDNGGKPHGMRKVYSVIEGRYKKKYGCEVSCDCMWRGEKYYMSLYEVYKDIRLVAAPPVSVAAFGGDEDNWEWPQQKGDFALYRIYTAPDGSPAEYSPDNVPLKPKKVLTISTDGVKKGDFTMIIGYPGITDRYQSSFKVSQSEKLINPITTSIRKERMRIIEKWMNEDPLIRLKYADKYFNLSNFQELKEGEMQCYAKYGVAAIKAEEEKGLNAENLKLLEEKYNAVECLEGQMNYFRETIVRGSDIAQLGYRINSFDRNIKDCESEPFVVADNKELMTAMIKVFEELDVRVEKDLLEYSLQVFFDNVDKKYWGGYLDSVYVKYGGSASAFIDDVWKNSIFSSAERMIAFTQQPHLLCDFTSDPIYKIFNPNKTGAFNQDMNILEGKPSINRLEKEYTQALYEYRAKKGMIQYPDANSTMRLTYGTVGSMEPVDGVIYLERSTTNGILQKENPNNYSFIIKPKMKKLLVNKEWGKWRQEGDYLQVDFLSDNDITGGNSGSPVLNAKGELVGLAFDGNKESLAGNAYFHPTLNKCINVDIRYVLWILDKYAGMDHILSEIGVK